MSAALIITQAEMAVLLLDPAFNQWLQNVSIQQLPGDVPEYALTPTQVKDLLQLDLAPDTRKRLNAAATL